MRALLVHLHKETRDQGALLVGVFAALPLLLALAMWAFEDRLLEADLRTAAPVATGIALVLFFLALAGDVFAGEVRRGTIDLMRRTPRAQRWAFVAKIVFVLVGAAAVLLWQALALQLTWAVWGRTHVPELSAILVESAPIATLIGVVGLWMVLASTWLRHGGMAVLLAPLLIAVLAVPAVLWAKSNTGLLRWLARDMEHGFLWIALGLGLVPIAAAAWSFLGGRRVVRSSWSAVWRGFVVLFLLSGSVYAYGAVRLDALLTFEPGDTGLQVGRAHVGTGSRYVFLDLCRVDGSNYNVRSPTQAWRIDLEEGTWCRVGGHGDYLDRPIGTGQWSYPGSAMTSLEPTPYVVLYRPTLDGERLAVWHDARTGKVLKTVAADVYTDDVLGWLDELGQGATWVRDGEGRRVWLRHGDALLRTEGERGGPGLDLRRRPFGHVAASTWGWVAMGTKAFEHVTVDAVTGAERTSEGQRRAVCHLSSSEVLGFHKGGGYVVEDLDSGIEQAAAHPPEDVQLLHSWNEAEVLCLGGPKAKQELLLWDPVRGTSRTIEWAPEPPPKGTTAWVVGRDAENTIVLGLSSRDGYAIARLDLERGHATRLTGASASMPWVVALEPEGSVVAVEPGVRVVRLGPAFGERDVLFPR